jgi:dipeptidyl aminopeptidase/acylaminoacyl peptidase
VRISKLLLAALVCLPVVAIAQGAGFQSSDLYKLHSVTDAAISPDGSRIAYTVRTNTPEGRGYGQLFIYNVAGRNSAQVGGTDARGGNPVWSPDGRSIAFHGKVGSGKAGLYVCTADGSSPRFLAEIDGTNSPLQIVGSTTAWSPDSKQIAFVSATPGPETKDATGDPIVITRYLYKPEAPEGLSHFNDNKRLHIFLVDAAGGAVKQLTQGDRYEHSIDWGPNGEILYVQNAEPNPDEFFNNDIFALNPATGAVRRLTATEGVEYNPRWSPDGKMIAYRATKRGLTDLETNMEDTHVWVMTADGSSRREVGSVIDDRQGAPIWSSDGQWLLFTVQERGNNPLYRLGVPSLAMSNTPQYGNEKREVLTTVPGSVFGYSVAKDGTIAAPDHEGDAFLLRGHAAERLTNINADFMRGKQVAKVESLTFISPDNKWNVEAFLTYPLNFDPKQKYPMVVNIHGGPHGQNGPSFNFRDQCFAAHGFAVLHVNYRGSTGYGQAFADAVFGDQDGFEGMDVLYGVSAAMRRYPWIDHDRLGIEGVSYGGQLTAWLITQTAQFHAAIPIAAITNFISYNYMTYYNQYEEMEWGYRPHQSNMMDVMWERSALKHVAAVKTPTMIQHGENDPDVPIAEAEQFYVALKDVGVETVFVRYPREGHGLSEPKHQVDSIDRSLAWYDAHFPKPGGPLSPQGRVPR